MLLKKGKPYVKELKLNKNCNIESVEELFE